MGKRIISQARGKGSLTYQARKQAFIYKIKYPMSEGEAEIINILHSAAHSAPLMKLKIASEIQKIDGKGFVIINAKDQIKETMIGTIASILSNSPLYEEGTIITTMAHYENKIKVSARSVGKTGRNVRDVLNRAVEPIGGQVGGHDCAAGCIITQDNENNFINNLKKNFEIEVVKI